MNNGPHLRLCSVYQDGPHACKEDNNDSTAQHRFGFKSCPCGQVSEAMCEVSGARTHAHTRARTRTHGSPKICARTQTSVSKDLCLRLQRSRLYVIVFFLFSRRNQSTPQEQSRMSCFECY